MWRKKVLYLKNTENLKDMIEKLDYAMVPTGFVQRMYAVSIDYQILADNTIEKSCAFDWRDWKSEDLTILTFISWSVGCLE